MLVPSDGRGCAGSMLEAVRDVLRDLEQQRPVPAELLRDLERGLDLDESCLQARGRA